MEETLKMMKLVLVGYEHNTSIKELLSDYKITYKPNILAYLFIKNYGIIYDISKKYTMLTDEDKASFCLQELDSCILNYSFDKGCEFITYFYSCFKNRLRTETEQLLTHIRYANYTCTDLDSCMNLYEFDNNLELYDYINNNLTAREKEHCKLLYMGYTNKELAQINKVSVQYIYNINKKIGKKLLNVV